MICIHTENERDVPFPERTQESLTRIQSPLASHLFNDMKVRYVKSMVLFILLIILTS